MEGLPKGKKTDLLAEIGETKTDVKIPLEEVPVT